MVNDQLSDFLTRIRNAGKARLSKADVMNTSLNRNVAEILAREGYIKSYKEVSVDNKTYLRVFLRFLDGDLKKPLIQGIKRESKPGLRRYVNAKEMPIVLSGLGMGILSTSKGLMTNKEARKSGVGGEYLCSVW